MINFEPNIDKIGSKMDQIGSKMVQIRSIFIELSNNDKNDKCIGSYQYFFCIDHLLFMDYSSIRPFTRIPTEQYGKNIEKSR